MKCIHCGSEWTSNEQSAKVMKNCPFCGKSLEKQEPVSQNPETMEDGLRMIHGRFGMEPFRNGKSLLGIHSDLLPARKKDRYLIGYFLDCNGNGFIEAALKKPRSEQPSALVQLVGRMYEERWIREDAARRIAAIWWEIAGGDMEAVKQLRSVPVSGEKKTHTDQQSQTGHAQGAGRIAGQTSSDKGNPSSAVCRREDYTISGKIVQKYNGSDQIVRIPDGIEYLNAWAFGGFFTGKKVEVVYIPEGIRAIGNCCFCECRELREIYLPDSLRVIESSAFLSCKKLRKIRLPEKLEVLGATVFQSCAELEEIRIPGTVSRISKECFFACRKLVRAELMNGVSSIEEKAFQNCESLRTIRIPDSITDIHPNAFSGCKNVSVFASAAWKKAHPDLLARIP